MDGVLTFYEQETFSFQAFLPDFLLPGPIKYISDTDSFLVGSYARNLEVYKYHAIATSAISGSTGKKLTPDYKKSLGEHLLDIQLVKSDPCIIQLLGERSLYTINASGNLVTMKKLEYNPSCLLAYPMQGKHICKNYMLKIYLLKRRSMKSFNPIWTGEDGGGFCSPVNFLALTFEQQEQSFLKIYLAF